MSVETEIKDAKEDKMDKEEYEMDPLPQRKSSKRESVALQKLDRRYSWLTEVEEKGADVITALISKTQYVAINNRFQKRLEEMKGDESLVAIYPEFAYLFEKFRTLYSASLKFQNKTTELMCKIKFAETEKKKILSDAAQYQQEAEKLKSQVQEAMKNISLLETEKANIARELREMKEEQVEPEIVMQEAEEDEEIDVPFAKMSSEGEDDEEKIKQLELKLQFLERELTQTQEREAKKRESFQKAEIQKAEMQKEIISAKSELQRQITHREKAEVLVADLQKDLEDKINAIKLMTAEIHSYKIETEANRNTIERLHADIRKLRKQVDLTAINFDNLKRDIDIRDGRLMVIKQQKDTISAELGAKQSEIHMLKVEVSRAVKEKNIYSKKVAHLASENSELQSKVEAIKYEAMALEREIESLVKEKSSTETKLRDITKQKDSLCDDIKKLEQAMSQLKIDAKVYREKIRVLAKEIDCSNKIIEDLKAVVKQEQRAKDILEQETNKLRNAIAKQKDDIGVLDRRISEAEKAISHLQKQLQDEEDKNKALSDKLRINQRLTREANQEKEHAKDTIAAMESLDEQQKSAIMNMGIQSNKLQIQKDTLHSEVGSLKELVRKQAKQKDELINENKCLKKYEQQLLGKISEMDHEISNMVRKLKHVTDERDVLNAKLVDSRNECASISEKLRLRDNDFVAMEKLYKGSQEDVKSLQLHVRQMNMEQSLMKQKVVAFEETRVALTEVQQEYMAEKLKSKNLEEEVQKPVNFHRWRALEGHDANATQLLVKNQKLQNQLLKKSAEIDDRIAEINERDRHIQELNILLKRRSDSDLPQKLVEYQKQIRDKSDKIKCIVTEIRMYQTCCYNYEQQIDVLKSEIKKYKYAEYKRIKGISNQQFLGNSSPEL